MGVSALENLQVSWISRAKSTKTKARQTLDISSCSENEWLRVDIVQ